MLQATASYTSVTEMLLSHANLSNPAPSPPTGLRRQDTKKGIAPSPTPSVAVSPASPETRAAPRSSTRGKGGGSGGGGGGGASPPPASALSRRLSPPPDDVRRLSHKQTFEPPSPGSDGGTPRGGRRGSVIEQRFGTSGPLVLKVHQGPQGVNTQARARPRPSPLAPWSRRAW